MKISEAITKANALRDNLLSDEQKVDWLRDLDGQVADFMKLEREQPEPGEEDSAEPAEPPKAWPFENVWPDVDAELLMPFPHEGVYVLYLVAQIDYYNQESDQYANDMAIYNFAMSEARAWWQRTHVPPVAGPMKVW